MAGSTHKLRHMSRFRGYQAGEANPAYVSVSLVQSNDGSGRREATAAGKLHDVHQEVPRAGKRPVLIIDFTIDMPLIRGGNQARNFFLKPLCPGDERGAKRGRFRRKIQSARRDRFP